MFAVDVEAVIHMSILKAVGPGKSHVLWPPLMPLAGVVDVSIFSLLRLQLQR